MLGHLTIVYILMAAEHFISEGGEVVPIRVNGLIKQSVLLTLPVDKSRLVQHVFWNFQSYIIASVTNGRLTVIKDEFKGRLEILEIGTALRIGQLRLNDSGLYTATVTFMDNTNLEASIILTVYELVPIPSIAIEAKELTSDWCNVTLRCSVPRNSSSMSYTWKYRRGDSDYQLSNTSTCTIQMSLQPESWDMEVLCKVQNPADQKNVSLQKFCSHYHGKGKSNTVQSFHGFLWPVLALVCLLILLAWFYFLWKRKQRKEPQNTNEEGIHYSDLKLEPQNAPTQALMEHVNASEPSEVIEYSTLKHGT